MSLTQILTLTILFHISNMRTFKPFYLFYAKEYLKSEFIQIVYYNRLTKLMQSNILALILYFKTSY